MVDCEKCSNFARMNLQIFRYITLSVVLTTALMLLSACSNSDDAPTTAAPAEAAPQEVHFNANVWRMMQGSPRRATTYDNQTALQNEGSFTCVVYNKNTTTEYVPATLVNWADSQWSFSGGKRYWPASGALDFFAYMPIAGSLPSYITVGPTYSADHDVTFTSSSLPMTNVGQGSDLKEFIYAMALDQDKAGTNGTLQPTAGQVALIFQHPFAKIKLQLSSTQTTIRINSITFKSIKNNGSFLYDHSETTSTWTPTGDATNFVATLNKDCVANEVIGTYLMIPQSWAGEIEVNASWNDWGDTPVAHTLTKTIPATWQAGYSYTYTFTISPDDLTVNTTNFTEQW